MKINFHIKTTNHDLTPDIVSEVHEKMGVIEKYINISGDTEVLAEVEIGLLSNHHKKGDIYRSEINLKYDGERYRATSENQSISESLDSLKDEISRQLAKHKDRKNNFFLKGAREIKRILKR